jgi:chromosome segregation ATPase
MSSLDAAERRLGRALDRLEAAIVRGARLEAGDEALADGALTREVEALRAECARLNHALEEARREHQQLRRVADQVAERLDGTIGEIDELLEA